MERAADHASTTWLSAAKQVVWDLIREGEPFTTDAVWERLTQRQVSTHEPRALGAVMRAAVSGGYLQASGNYFKSQRPEAHSRPVPLWIPLWKATP